jgi:hypothetical protein
MDPEAFAQHSKDPCIHGMDPWRTDPQKHGVSHRRHGDTGPQFGEFGEFAAF